MKIIEEIKNKSSFDVISLVDRLAKEFRIEDDESKEQIHYALFDTLNIILNTINQRKITKELYSIWYEMTKDYWYLNKYDEFVKTNNNYTNKQLESDNKKIKSITVGDTTTTFCDVTSQININGTTYNTGTIEFSENVLLEKYKNQLYKFRKMRW